MDRKPARVPASGRGCLPEPALLCPARAVQLSPDCRAWCGASAAPGSECAPRPGGGQGWRAGPAIWGSASRHLCRRHGRVFQREQEKGRRRGEAEGVNQVGMGIESNSKAETQKDGSVLSLGFSSHWVSPPPALTPHPPPPSPRGSPSPSPANATIAARVCAGPVGDSQAEEDYPDHGLPARSHSLSPWPQSAPSTRTVAGDLRPRFPRLKLQEDSKQKKTNRGGGESRVSEPRGHL